MKDKHDIKWGRTRRRQFSFLWLTNEGLSLAAAGMVGGLMFLTFADVVGRYVFNRPIFGAYELIEVLMGLLIFAGLPLVSRSRAHITVDFISYRLPATLAMIQKLIVNLLCGATAGVMAWRIWVYGSRLSQFNETTLELGISRGLIAKAMAVMLAFTSLVFLLNTWDSLTGKKSAKQKE